MHNVALLAGARPNYMKIYPLWRVIHDQYANRIKPIIIHTGQHYDPLMNDIFFRDLGMPKPDHFLGVGSGPHGSQTGRTMIAMEVLLEKNRPDLLVVVGDINSTVAGTLVAVKLGIPVAHVEAGLRSGDRTMPEEINRLVTDAISDVLLTPSRDANDNLLREGISPEKIHFVGNVMIDSLIRLLPEAQKSQILQKTKVNKGYYVAVTLHRPSNVDDPACLIRIMKALEEVATQHPVVLPLHPRTRKRLESVSYDPTQPRLKLVDPLGYLDFLCLESNAALVITDSGGVQEETTYLGIPCLTLRPNTERPITITHGTNRLLDPERDNLAHAAHESILTPPSAQAIELWDGQAATRIVQILSDILDC